MRRHASISLLTTAALAPCLWAQEPIDPDIVAKIKEEGLNNSQVMDTLFYLTDVYGPRLANSPMYNRAARWAVQRMESYGLENARLEPWGEVGDGWTLKGFQLELLQPSYAPLIGYPGARTASTEGTIEGTPILFAPGDDETDQDVARRYAGLLEGAIVLHGGVTDRRRSNAFAADANRRSDDALMQLASAQPRGGGRRGVANAAARGRGQRGRGGRGRRGGRGGRGGGRGGGFNINQFFADEGVACVLRVGTGGVEITSKSSPA